MKRVWLSVAVAAAAWVTAPMTQTFPLVTSPGA